MISVLYVDDEPALLEIGKLFLERNEDFRVDTVTSAAGALAIIGSGKYDVVISDYLMPGLNGIDFLKQLRASGNSIPFVIFTGRGREEVVIQAFNEGADFYIQKGGEPGSQFAELAHKVRQAVSKRRAEASLRDHEQREADIINFLPDATFAINTRGEVIAWNKAMEKMTGVKSREILGKGNYEYAIPFYQERRPILIDLVLSDDPATAGRYPAITRDGKKLISEITIPHFHDGRGAVLWFTASPLYDSRGNVVGAIESIREITERKRAQDALNESERRFRELSDMLPQIIFETDTEGNLTYANRIAFEKFGYTPQDLRQGLNALGMITPEDRGRAATGIFAVISGADLGHGNEEYAALRRDGSTFPVSIYSSPIIRDGKPAGMRGIIIDITERKLAEERIRESEQNYRHLFENATEGILIAQGDRLVHINPALVSLLGRPAEEIMSRPFADFIFPDDRGMVMDRHLKRMRGETPPTGYMFRIITGDGQEKWVYITSDRITWSGKPATLSFLTDMTKLKRAEESLVAANREYTNLLNQIQDVYYRTDGDGRLIQASTSWATMFGYADLSECLGRSVADDFYLNPADREQLVDIIDREGRVTNYEVLLKKKDGTPIIVETSSHYSPDPTGAAPGIEGIFRDITERKRQEAILRTQLALGVALQTITGMHETLEACLDAAIAVSGMDSGGIYLVDEERSSLDLVLSRNFGGPFVASTSHYPPGSPNWEMVMAGLPRFIPSSELGIATSQVREQEGLRSVAIIPILSGGRSVACMNIASHTEIDIPEGARVALETIATQIGGAIERTRARNALTESEERYRSLSELSPDLIFVVDAKDRVTYVNTSAAKMLGVPARSIIGRYHSDLFPPEILERQRYAIRKVFETGEISRSTGKLTSQGRTFWFDHSLTPIRDEAGTVNRVLGVSHDISERKETEEVLRIRTEELDSRNRLLSTLLDTVPIGIFMVEAPSGKPIVANREATRLLGRGILPDATEENLGEVYEAYQGGCSGRYPRDRMPIIRGMDGECSHVDDMVVVRPDGTEVHLEVFGTPVVDNRGCVSASLVCFFDITGRKRAEEMIQRLAQFPAEDPHPVLRFGADGTLLYANTPGQDWLAALHAGQQVPDPFLPLVADAMNQEGIHATEVEDTSGRVYQVTAIRPGGEEYINLYVTEITGRRQAERAMQEAHEKINLLTSITRHDVANQVAILRGLTELAMKSTPDPDISSLLAKIDQAGAEIARHVEFTRTYQEIGMHAPEWFFLDALAERLKPERVSLSGTCRIVAIFADPMLEKVFQNLFDNALRHGVRVTAITIRCTEGPRGLTVFFEDNGTGIRPEHKEKIFERGFGENTGMGLFLSREILEITGITIAETGTSGEGARFELHVPCGKYRIIS